MTYRFYVTRVPETVDSGILTKVTFVDETEIFILCVPAASSRHMGPKYKLFATSESDNVMNFFTESPAGIQLLITPADKMYRRYQVDHRLREHWADTFTVITVVSPDGIQVLSEDDVMSKESKVYAYAEGRSPVPCSECDKWGGRLIRQLFTINHIAAEKPYYVFGNQPYIIQEVRTNIADKSVITNATTTRAAPMSGHTCIGN